MCCWKVQVSCFYIDDTRYKTKKPVPSNNTYVAVDGFLDHICVDTGHVIMVMWDAKLNVARGGRAKADNRTKGSEKCITPENNMHTTNSKIVLIDTNRMGA